MKTHKIKFMKAVPLAMITKDLPDYVPHIVNIMVILHLITKIPYTLGELEKIVLQQILRRGSSR